MKRHPFIPLVAGFLLLLGVMVFVTSWAVFSALCIGSIVLEILGLYLNDLHRRKSKFFEVCASDIMPALRKVFGLFVLAAGVLVLISGDSLHDSDECQFRIKVSRASSDMRYIHTALNAYHEVNTAYPAHLAPYLTSPIAYVEQVPVLRFPSQPPAPFHYFSTDKYWILGSPYQPGKSALDWDAMSTETLQRLTTDKSYRATMTYDSTNGSASTGSLFRLSNDTLTR
jgi:hypothetical protein